MGLIYTWCCVVLHFLWACEELTLGAAVRALPLSQPVVARVDGVDGVIKLQPLPVSTSHVERISVTSTLLVAISDVILKQFGRRVTSCYLHTSTCLIVIAT
jgi:hypothetical protein